jgi:putative membrane protein insertion efficiency factor
VLKSILSIPKKIGMILIRIYQLTLSLDHSFWAKKLNLGIRVCIHEPSCSEYTYQAIDRFGLVKGSISGVFRILRCNPFSKGGFDPLSKKWKETIRLK